MQAGFGSGAVGAASAEAGLATADARPAMAQGEHEAAAEEGAPAAPTAAPADAGGAAIEAGLEAGAAGRASAAASAAPAHAGQALAQPAVGRRPHGASHEAPDPAAGSSRLDPVQAAPGTDHAAAVLGAAPHATAVAQSTAASREALSCTAEAAAVLAGALGTLLPLAYAVQKEGHAPDLGEAGDTLGEAGTTLVEAGTTCGRLHAGTMQLLPVPGPRALPPAAGPAPAPPPVQLVAWPPTHPAGCASRSPVTPAAAAVPSGNASPVCSPIPQCQVPCGPALIASPCTVLTGGNGQLKTRDDAALLHAEEESAGAARGDPLQRGSGDELPTWNGAKFRAMRGRSTFEETRDSTAQGSGPRCVAATPARERVPTWRQATLGGGPRAPLRDARSDSGADSGDSDWRPAAEHSDPDDDAAWESEPEARRGRAKAPAKAVPRRCRAGGDTLIRVVLSCSMLASEPEQVAAVCPWLGQQYLSCMHA